MAWHGATGDVVKHSLQSLGKPNLKFPRCILVVLYVFVFPMCMILESVSSSCVVANVLAQTSWRPCTLAHLQQLTDEPTNYRIRPIRNKKVEKTFAVGGDE